MKATAAPEVAIRTVAASAGWGAAGSANSNTCDQVLARQRVIRVASWGAASMRFAIACVAIRVRRIGWPTEWLQNEVRAGRGPPGRQGSAPTA